MAIAAAGVVAALIAPVTGAAASDSHERAPSAEQVQRVCAPPSRPDIMTCFALRRVDHSDQRLAPGALPSGYGPGALRSAYKLAAAAKSGGVGETVAVVDAYNDPTAASDLATYRSTYGLPSCTTTNGCFAKVNQNGLRRDYPANNTDWAGEISLDVDMVSAICPRCHILLVEADDANASSLGTSVNTAVRLGAKYVSNSYGGPERHAEYALDRKYWHHDGVVMTASTGDGGYGAIYPAASQYVTAVGGTSLVRSGSPRGWHETAWSGAGSGCSTYEPTPYYQFWVATSCGNRGIADVAAVANPRTGVAVYQSYGGSGWMVYGGTSAASPIIAAVYALAGTPPPGSSPVSFPYLHENHLFDVTSGANGTCRGRSVCTAGPGWDGPTGLGTPNGTSAFEGTRWFGPLDLGMHNLVSAPSTAVTSDGQQYVFWVNAGGYVTEAFWNGSTWVGPEQHDFGQMDSAPSVAVDKAGHVYVYWEGPDQNLVQAVWDGTSWSGPTDIGMGPLGSAPAVAVASDGQRYVFWKGTDNRLREARWNGLRWIGPVDLGFGPLKSAPTAAVDSAGHQFVFWQGYDNRLKQVSWTGGWSRPLNLGMGPLDSAPSAAIGADGQRYVFCQSTGGMLEEAYWNGRNWVGRVDIGIGTLSTSPTVGVDGANRLYVFWEGPNLHLKEAHRSSWP
jgi:hypothetical protein